MTKACVYAAQIGQEVYVTPISTQSLSDIYPEALLSRIDPVIPCLIYDLGSSAFGIFMIISVDCFVDE